MTSNGSRIARGRDSQRIVARYFAEAGWPYAEPVGAFRGGADITGMPGLACEVKAERGWRPTTWLRQAAGGKCRICNGTGLVECVDYDGSGYDQVCPECDRGSVNRSGLPFVVARPDGYGPAAIGAWPVIIRLDDFTALLKEAGHGD